MTAERIRERYQFIYLLFQELLLLGICLFGLGGRIGIAAPFGAPLAAGVTAVLLFTWVCSLRRRERAFAFAALACGILAAVPAAGESGAAFFASYRSWLVESGRNLIADGAAETVRNSFPGIGIIAGAGQV